MMATPCYYCEENRDYACKVCIHHYEGPTVEELKNQSDRIRELESELAAIRQQHGEPVAWIYAEDQGRGHRFLSELPPTSHHPQDLADAEVVVTPLYREVAPRVPEGWKLVPDVATEKMLRRAEEMRGFNAAFVYQAMLAAAPQPPEPK